MKVEADSLFNISIYWLRKRNYLTGCKHGKLSWGSNSHELGSIGITTYDLPNQNFALLHYQHSDGYCKDEIRYKVLLTHTQCNFGGKRYWFVCPGVVGGVYCGRRVAKLYAGGELFLCRHCYNLTYKSRNYSHKYRHGFYKIVDLVCRSDEIEETIKKHYYRGKSTRKYTQVEKIGGRLGQLTR